MNYQQIYDNLISHRLKNPATGYVERHHIIMKSMGGSNDPSNLVVLTGREHWIAHLLLYKIYKNSQTVHACHMMAMRCEERDISYIKNSRLYEEVRKHHARLTSKRNSHLMKGMANSQYGTRWICNLESQENKKISKEDNIPQGWVLGRNKWKISTPKNFGRTRLKTAINITNGIKSARLLFEDQIIPDGWWQLDKLSVNFYEIHKIIESGIPLYRACREFKIPFNGKTYKKFNRLKQNLIGD
jgi:hypothetical protein